MRKESRTRCLMMGRVDCQPKRGPDKATATRAIVQADNINHSTRLWSFNQLIDKDFAMIGANLHGTTRPRVNKTPFIHSQCLIRPSTSAPRPLPSPGN